MIGDFTKIHLTNIERDYIYKRIETRVETVETVYEQRVFQNHGLFLQSKNATTLSWLTTINQKR